MDANKLALLQDIDYSISRSCGNCIHSQLNGDWGTCNKFTYRHQKHTDSVRQLSINRYGQCMEHELNPTFNVEGFTVFVSTKEPT